MYTFVPSTSFARNVLPLGAGCATAGGWAAIGRPAGGGGTWADADGRPDVRSRAAAVTRMRVFVIILLLEDGNGRRSAGHAMVLQLTRPGGTFRPRRDSKTLVPPAAEAA